MRTMAAVAAVRGDATKPSPSIPIVAAAGHHRGPVGVVAVNGPSTPPQHEEHEWMMLQEQPEEEVDESQLPYQRKHGPLVTVTVTVTDVTGGELASQQLQSYYGSGDHVREAQAKLTTPAAATPVPTVPHPATGRSPVIATGGYRLKEPVLDPDVYKSERLYEMYSFSTKLGQGQFGSVVRATCNVTKKQYAAKFIEKAKIRSKWEMQDIRNEVKILEHLRTLPAISSSNEFSRVSLEGSEHRDKPDLRRTASSPSTSSASSFICSLFRNSSKSKLTDLKTPEGTPTSNTKHPTRRSFDTDVPEDQHALQVLGDQLPTISPSVSNHKGSPGIQRSSSSTGTHIRRTTSVVFPGVAHMQAAYEDADYVVIILELCTGGELLHNIIHRGFYSEYEAAKAFRAILQSISYVHSRGIIHGDLKPENFLLFSERVDSQIKMVDFGLSTFFTEGQTFKQRVGTPYYMAPEVIDKAYGCEADVWSAGVILYVLLCGRLPFWGENRDKTYNKIFFDEPDFSQDPWPQTSRSAKDLLKRLLCKDRYKRIKPLEALSHEWLRVGGNAARQRITPTLQKQLKQFTKCNMVQRVARLMIARQILSSGHENPQLIRLKQIFASIDLDGSNFISQSEFHHALNKVTNNMIDRDDANDVLKALDIQSDGQIDYEPFLAAAMDYNTFWSDSRIEQHATEAFDYLDANNDGLLSVEEIQAVYYEEFDNQYGDAGGIADVLHQIDGDGDGKITRDEFIRMLGAPNTTTNPVRVRRKDSISRMVGTLFFGIADCLQNFDDF